MHNKIFRAAFVKGKLGFGLVWALVLGVWGLGFGPCAVLRQGVEHVFVHEFLLENEWVFRSDSLGQANRL